MALQELDLYELNPFIFNNNLRETSSPLSYKKKKILFNLLFYEKKKVKLLYSFYH